MKFNIITIFPEMITDYTSKSVLRRGQDVGVIEISAVNLRDFAEGKHRQIDDTPYGGGAGMVMKPDPIHRALSSIGALKKGSERNVIKKTLTKFKSKKKKRTILMSPRGRQFDQRVAEEFAVLDELTIVCGRYEGIDQRVVDHMVDEEISIGPYVLAGGELGSLVVTEAVSRLIPGVLGNPESLEEETFGRANSSPPDQGGDRGGLELEIEREYPQYTKPADFMGWQVPEILLSGDHEKIRNWRRGRQT